MLRIAVDTQQNMNISSTFSGKYHTRFHLNLVFVEQTSDAPENLSRLIKSIYPRIIGMSEFPRK